MLQTYSPGAHSWSQIAQALQAWAQSEAGISSPDLSSLCCVVPDISHASLLRQALQARAPGTALLPPRIYTLATLAQDWGSDDGRIELDQTARCLTVYDVLRDQVWTQKMTGDSADTGVFWSLARQLLELCDELSTWLEDSDSPLLTEANGLQAWLQQQFGARAELLSFEAQLLLKVWHALRDPCNPPDLLRQRLQRVPQQAAQRQCRALCWIMGQPWEELPAWQRRWAQSCAESMPFQVWYPVWDGAFDHAASAQNWHIVECADLEQEALTAVRAIWAQSQQRQHAPQALAVIAQDLTVARRLQALLRRAQVPVQDDSGWKLSTSAAATVLMRWLEASLDQAPWNTVLEVIKSPFVSLAPAAVQSRLAHMADLTWRATQTRQGWSALHHSLEQALLDQGNKQADSSALLDALALLAQESRRLHSSGTLARQIQTLLQGMQALGMSERFEQDAAGMEIVQLLKTTLQALPEPDQVVLTLHEFQAWLSQQFETRAFRPVSTSDQGSGLSVSMVSLTAARLRPWDAIVWVGAGAELMQPAPPETLFFGSRVRHELGLPTRAQAQRQMERHLLELLNLNVPTTLTWRARQGDEPLALAPLLTRLHLSALRQQLPAFVRPYAAEWQACAPQALEPQASVPVDTGLLPTRLSARHWEALVACPYRFWAQAVWHLGERDEIQDSASKRDYGNAVHQILYRAHTLAEQRLEQDFAVLLDAVATEIFSALAQSYPDAFTWQQRFDNWKTEYLLWWQQERELGWRWQGGELRREYRLPLEPDRHLTLHGRLDRLDRHEQDRRFRILDYKAKSHDQLKRMQRETGEQVQLLFYGLLCQSEAEQHNFGLNAAYLPAENTGKEFAAYPVLQDDDLFLQTLQAEKRRLQTVWLSLTQGRQLRAQGSTVACAYCAMRGLCRRDERETPLNTGEPAA